MFFASETRDLTGSCWTQQRNNLITPRSWVRVWVSVEFEPWPGIDDAHGDSLKCCRISTNWRNFAELSHGKHLKLPYKRGLFKSKTKIPWKLSVQTKKGKWILFGIQTETSRELSPFASLMFRNGTVNEVEWKTTSQALTFAKIENCARERGNAGHKLCARIYRARTSEQKSPSDAQPPDSGRTILQAFGKLVIHFQE